MIIPWNNHGPEDGQKPRIAIGKEMRNLQHKLSRRYGKLSKDESMAIIDQENHGARRRVPKEETYNFLRGR